MREVIAVGLATALCRRILRRAITIRVLDFAAATTRLSSKTE